VQGAVFPHRFSVGALGLTTNQKIPKPHQGLGVCQRRGLRLPISEMAGWLLMGSEEIGRQPRILDFSLNQV
jgi:hypothetical protein